MTKAELFAALDDAGMPWCNEDWEPQVPPPLPYVVACWQSGGQLHADNLTHGRRTVYRLEVYSRGRAYEVEDAVTGALTAHGLPWSFQTAGPVGGGVFQTSITVPVTGN